MAEYNLTNIAKSMQLPPAAIGDRISPSDGEVYRTCTVCHQGKPLTAFYPSNSSPLGRRTVCKRCSVRETFKDLHPKGVPQQQQPPPEELATMREISFKGMKNQTKVNMSAVMWATNRRGRAPWKNDNVVQQITEYLDKNGVFIHPEQPLGRTMELFETRGYGKRVVRGKRTVQFEFLPDVVLTGVEPIFDPDKVAAIKKAAAAESEPKSVVAAPAPVAAPGATGPEIGMPPTPSQVLKPPLYRFVEFLELVGTWGDKHPDDYGKWVDTVIPWLEGQS